MVAGPSLIAPHPLGSVVFAGAEVAAVLAASPVAVRQGLAAYGKHLGTAYQLVDDVLDYRSNPVERGKNLGDDLAEGKPTLPLIHALRSASEADRALIRTAIRQGGLAQLEPIVAAIESTGGIAYASRVAQRESELALQALEQRWTAVLRSYQSHPAVVMWIVEDR